MRDVKVPGLLWTALIALAIVAIESYLPDAYQLYAETGVVVLLGVAKAANLGVKEIEDLVELLRQIQNRPQPSQASGVGAPRMAAPVVDVKKYEPNKALRFLVG